MAIRYRHNLGCLLVLVSVFACPPVANGQSNLEFARDRLTQGIATAVGSASNLSFTTIDVPGAAYTGAYAINSAGEVIGNYGRSVSTDSHGFRYCNGSFTYFDYPGQVVTIPTGINDFGQIVGYATQAPQHRTIVIGFLFDESNFITLKEEGQTATYAFGINNAALIVGGTGSIYATNAFGLHDGQYQPIIFPGIYVYAFANGINNVGEVVGYTDDGADQHGFAYKNGKFQNVDFPGLTTSHALGINDKGLIVGWYQDVNYFYSFIKKNGKYVSFGYPGAVGTFASGVNSSGQIVGEYTFDYTTFHGFVTSPVTVDGPSL